MRITIHFSQRRKGTRQEHFFCLWEYKQLEVLKKKVQDLENDRTWSNVRDRQYQQAAKETNEISDITSYLLVLWRIVCHLC